MVARPPVICLPQAGEGWGSGGRAAQTVRQGSIESTLDPRGAMLERSPHSFIHSFFISAISRNYLGPGGADSVYEEVDCFSKFKRTRLTMDAFPVEFGSLRRKAAFSEACVLALRVRDAALSQSEKSRVSASVPGELGSTAAPHPMRRLPCPRGGAARCIRGGRRGYAPK